jgi:hypothetical protein
MKVARFCRRVEEEDGDLEGEEREEGTDKEKEKDTTKRVLSTTALTTRLEVAGEVTIDIGIV